MVVLKTLRGTFIIDHQGYIHGMELLTNSVERCPGERTIKQSIEMSGSMWKQWKPNENNFNNFFYMRNTTYKYAKQRRISL